MDPRCTCGAILPPDARFCHKCGKPQNEEDAARLAELETQAIPAAGEASAGSAKSEIVAGTVNFSNSRAVLITLAVAVCAFAVILLSSVLSPALFPVVLCASGFFAYRVYRKRTAGSVSAGGAAFLGFMTGLWIFLAFLVIAAISCAYLASDLGRQMLAQSASQFPSIFNNPELASVIADPHAMIWLLIKSLIPLFFSAAIFPAFGGLIAARLTKKQA